MDHFTKCFEKHSFTELNDIDVGILLRAYQVFLSKFSVSNPVVFDIGTNAGSFVKVLEHFNVTKNVHCFEPHPILSEVTRKTYPFVKMNIQCVGNQNGVVQMYFPKWSVGLSSLINRTVFSTLQQDIVRMDVLCETIDTYCERNGIDEIDFVKIDVEGAEKMVFEGAKRMLETKKIKFGIFEVGTTLTDAGTSEEELVSMLYRYVYTIERRVSKDNFIFYLQ